MIPSTDRLLRFAVPLAPETTATLRTAILAAVAADPDRPVVVDLVDVRILDSAIIAALIRLGRDVRERGGSMALCGGSPKVVETLRITALDRVFPVLERPAAATAPATPPRGASRRRGTRIASGLAGAFATAALLAGSAASAGSSASAAPEPSPQEIVSNVIAQNPDMRTYEAQLSVELKLKSFPWLSQHLDATTYFKRPNNYEVVFHDVPAYARGFEKLYSDIDDPSGWANRFSMTVVGRRAFGNRADVVVRLVQRVRGMIDHQDVAIDPEHWRIDAMEWHYYNGGEISMTQDFASAGPFSVLSAQHATIRIPHVSASAEASYTAYRTNVSIDDSVFAKSSGQAAK